VPKGIRPGIVLHARAIRRAIDAGLSEYDFLGGTSQYKLDLATNVRPLAGLRAAPFHLAERARGAAERGLALVRQLRGTQ
jgi:CelD/BcsL family acetyltransferase involved in cellulose biosynthesis